MIKAVILDMDGLLIDSEPLWQESEIEIFANAGINLTRENCKEAMGLRIDEVVDYWFSKYPWKEPTKKEIENGIVKRVIELVRQKGEAKRGISEIVQIFLNKNIPLAIASSSQSEIINVVLEKISIREYIKVICSAENEPYGKPHPGVYITTAKKLNIEPKYCLVFEDSPNGVRAAKEAGMKCIAVPDQNQLSKGDKRFLIADMIIDSLEDFRPEYLGKF